MTTEAGEPWWTQQDADIAWIARQEAISAAFAAAALAAAIEQRCHALQPSDAIEHPVSEPPAV